jgi:hypothetical protein
MASRLGRSCKAKAMPKKATATAAAAAAAAAATAASAAEADDWSVCFGIETSAATAAAAVAPRGSVRAQIRQRETNDALLLEAAPKQSRVVDNPGAAPGAAIAVGHRDEVRGEQLFTASGISITIPHDVPDACVRGDVEENVVVVNPEAATAAAAEAARADLLASMISTYRAKREAEERLSQLRDQQARVDWHNEVASQPSPWSDMDETSCRVGFPAGSAIRFPFAVDESGAVSIIAPPGGGSPCTACHVQHSGSCCFFDLLRADVEKLGLLLEMLPEEPILSGAIYLTMCEIHTTLTERVITEDIYVELHSLVEHIVRDCNLLPIFNPGA